MPRLRSVLVAVLNTGVDRDRSYDPPAPPGSTINKTLTRPRALEVNQLVAIAQARGGGRIYAGLPTNWGHELHRRRGTRLHLFDRLQRDSIGFTLRTTSLMTGPEAYFDESNLGDYSTFGVRYLLLPQGHAPPVPATFDRARWTLRALGSEIRSGLIQVVDTQSSIAANGSELGNQTSSFLDSGLPGKGIYPTIAYAGQPAAASTLPSGASPVGRPARSSPNTTTSRQGRAVATVFARRTAVVLLKSSS